MVEYKCFRCGYTAKQKTHLLNHLNRKNICRPLLEDIRIEEVKKHYGFKIKNLTTLFDTQIAPSEHLLAPSEHFLSTQILNSEHPLSTQIAPSEHLLAPKKVQKTFLCKFCNKSFTRKTGLTKHLKCCKKKNENDENTELFELKKQHEELKEQVEDLLIELSKQSTISNTTNNNTTNNTTNNQNKIINININNFGNENTKYLRKDYLNNLLEKAFTAIPKLIEKIHFNPKHPENHNIKITNKKEPYIKVRKNDKWELQDKKETLENLVDDKYYILEDHYAEVEEKKEIPEHTKNVMNKFRDKFTEDKELQKDLQKKSEMIILNNS